MSEGKIIEIYNQGLTQVMSVIRELTNEIKSLNSQIETLSKDNKSLSNRVKSLENQTNKNSNNSSKPPSSDGFKKKTKSLRVKTDKNPGGQEGHEGKTLELSDNPDEIITHSVDTCDICGTSLQDVKAERNIIRQVVDIPDIKVKVVEHRAEIKKCPRCRRKNTGKFPEGITNTVQYGEKIKAVSVYLTQYQLIPYKRGAELISDLFDINLSQGSMVNFNDYCHENLKSIEENIKASLINSKGAVHFDETGVAIDKKRKWLHVASNDKYTYYEAHEKRGKEAVDSIGILPNFIGTAVHDCWKTYLQYTDCDHSLCNAHILRELNGISELEKQSWAEPMKNLLTEIKKEVDLNWNIANALTLDKIEAFEERYTQILNDGFKEDYIANSESYAKKKAKKSTSLNLLNRLSTYREQILAFMYDFDIPFDNNLAERDLRMAKVKQKISGTFRSGSGAKSFACIRGYVSTVRKQGMNALKCIKSTFTENPVDPTLA
ncbi:IS66 family transposase [Clostridium manihotivorum]|uniref:Transposase n=1 Tax=Clostridium manihotivorum TaxID=2320868 RepID=A0A410DWU6_9CLOT|nr:IS66 family transposase [Clostridium manihotivorum]QAA33554.1 transposase [Clostridium manihotivorum]